MTTGQVLGYLIGGITIGAIVKNALTKETPQKSIEDFVGSIRNLDCSSTFRSKEGRTLCQGFKVGIEVPFQNSKLPERR